MIALIQQAAQHHNDVELDRSQIAHERYIDHMDYAGWDDFTMSLCKLAERASRRFVDNSTKRRRLPFCRLKF